MLTCAWSWQVLSSDFSPQAAAAVMRRLSKLSARFIGERGFSIGVDDVIPVPRLSDEVANVTRSSYQACQVCEALWQEYAAVCTKSFARSCTWFSGAKWSSAVYKPVRVCMWQADYTLDSVSHIRKPAAGMCTRRS